MISKYQFWALIILWANLDYRIINTYRKYLNGMGSDFEQCPKFLSGRNDDQDLIFYIIE